MATFGELIAASPEELVRLFYRIKAAESSDFIARINHVAAQLEVNHGQLVCALGFNRNILDMTDVLSLLGFSSFKLLSYRRNDIFVTDTYRALNIDNVLDIYTARIDDDDFLGTLQELLPQRFDNIEKALAKMDDTNSLLSYRMELHSVYASGIALPEFALNRMQRSDATVRRLTREVEMVIASGVIPAANLFFLDTLVPEEKKILIDGGEITEAMIRNRIQNTSISAEERDLLENYI